MSYSGTMRAGCLSRCRGSQSPIACAQSCRDRYGRVTAALGDTPSFGRQVAVLLVIGVAGAVIFGMSGVSGFEPRRRR